MTYEHAKDFLPRNIELKIEGQIKTVGVVVSPSIKDTDAGGFLEEFYIRANRTLEKVSSEVGKFKSHGRRRSQREIREIRKDWNRQKGQIEDMLKVFNGEKEGKIEILTDNKEEMVAIQILSNS